MSSFVTRKVFPLLALFSFAAIPLSGFAGTITGTSFTGGPGGTVSSPFVLTVSEGNDNQPGGPGTDNNIVVPLKVFTATDYIDIEFTVRDSSPSGVTEYHVIESVDNDTGIDWTSYEMSLGFGVGASFSLSASGDGLDFDHPDFDPSPSPSSSAFPSVILGEDLLVFTGGIQGSGAKSYDIRIDVPDNITSFTLRQVPVTIPEPSSIALGMLSLTGLLFRRRSIS